MATVVAALVTTVVMVIGAVTVAVTGVMVVVVAVHCKNEDQKATMRKRTAYWKGAVQAAAIQVGLWGTVAGQCLRLGQVCSQVPELLGTQACPLLPLPTGQATIP